MSDSNRLTDKSLIIIGAGIAGLATGCYARMNSYRAQIFELHGRRAKSVSLEKGRQPMHKACKLPLLGAVLALTAMSLTACGSGEARFSVEAKDNLTFTPDTITVKAGQPVDLTLVNKGTLDHTFTIPDLNIEVIMRPGETNHITFTAPKAGEYRIICGIHFDKMQGKLIVQ